MLRRGGSAQFVPMILLAALALSTERGMAQQASVAGKALREAFPAELVDFAPRAGNPVFSGAGPGRWDAKIRERGWILHEGDTYHLWYTGYDGTREGIKQLGYATSPDGFAWTRWPENPLCAGHWVEDMMVVKQGEVYYMFAEGLHDEAQLLTSRDRVHWDRQGKLDIRMSDGRPLSPGPYGTPTAWLEDGLWHLFYERGDKGVWLATSRDLKVWKNVQDQSVLQPGPESYDKNMIALNQIVKRDGVYFAYYHGSGDEVAPRKWSTNVARSTDLLRWEKFPGNPVVGVDHSSGIVSFDRGQTRLYTMHNEVDVFVPRQR